MQILTIARISFKEFMRRRVVYGIFLVAVVFIMIGKGCNPGTLRGEGVFFEKQTVREMETAAAFHLISFWSIMLCGFVAATALTREIEDGTAFLTLSRPVRRSTFVVGKLISVVMISGGNLFVLGGVFSFLYYSDAGTFEPRIFTALGFMLVSLLLYALMTMLMSLVLPRLITPLLGLIVYVMSCWNALPFYSNKIRMLWIPSETVERMHAYFPQFGDLQYIGASLIQSLPDAASLQRPLVFVALYCASFLALTIYLFSRKQL